MIQKAPRNNDRWSEAVSGLQGEQRNAAERVATEEMQRRLNARGWEGRAEFSVVRLQWVGAAWPQGTDPSRDSRYVTGYADTQGDLWALLDDAADAAETRGMAAQYLDEIGHPPAPADQVALAEQVLAVVPARYARVEAAPIFTHTKKGWRKRYIGMGIRWFRDGRYAAVWFTQLDDLLRADILEMYCARADDALARAAEHA